MEVKIYTARMAAETSVREKYNRKIAAGLMR